MYLCSCAELEEYAEHLGLTKEDISTHRELLMLAYEGLTTPLPPEWEACITPEDDGDLLYRNKSTGQVFDEHPNDSYYRQLAQELKKSLKSNQNSQSSIIQQQLSEIEEDQNEFKNESDTYEREKYYPLPILKNILRKSMEKEDFKHIVEGELKIKEEKLIRDNRQSQYQQQVWLGRENKINPPSALPEISETFEIDQKSRSGKIELSLTQKQKEKVRNIGQKREQLKQLEKELQRKVKFLHTLKKTNHRKVATIKDIYKKKY